MANEPLKRRLHLPCLSAPLRRQDAASDRGPREPRREPRVWLPVLVRAARGETYLPAVRLRCMPSPEEYRKRAKAARQQANTCRNEYERQGLLIIADQCERIAVYKDLTGRPSRVTAPAQADLTQPPTLRPPLKPDDGSPNKQQPPIILAAKP